MDQMLRHTKLVRTSAVGWTDEDKVAAFLEILCNLFLLMAGGL